MPSENIMEYTAAKSTGKLLVTSPFSFHACVCVCVYGVGWEGWGVIYALILFLPGKLTTGRGISAYLELC